MAAAHYKLDNLIAFVDNNGLQIDGNIIDVMSPAPIGEKFKAFGWFVQEIDGHDFQAIEEALKRAKANKERDCRAYGERQRCVLYGKSGFVARQRTECRAGSRRIKRTEVKVRGRI